MHLTQSALSHKCDVFEKSRGRNEWWSTHVFEKSLFLCHRPRLAKTYKGSYLPFGIYIHLFFLLWAVFGIYMSSKCMWRWSSSVCAALNSTCWMYFATWSHELASSFVHHGNLYGQKLHHLSHCLLCTHKERWILTRKQNQKCLVGSREWTKKANLSFRQSLREMLFSPNFFRNFGEKQKKKMQNYKTIQKQLADTLQLKESKMRQT